MPNNLPLSYFSDRLDFFEKQLTDVVKKIRTTSFLRVGVFMGSVLGIYITMANGYPLLSIPFFGGFIYFIFLVRSHLQLEKRKAWYEANISINKEEKLIANGDTVGMDPGSEFIDPDHPFIDDLDVFGRKSLFQLINRTATSQGRKKLADTLSFPIFDINRLVLRQKAVAEISKIPDWRQSFQATGKLFNEEKNDQNDLIAWASKNANRFDTLFNKLMLILTPILGFGIIILIQFNILTISAFFLFLIIPFALIGTKLTLLNRLHTEVSKKSGLLNMYSELFNLIKNENFKSELLVGVQRNIGGKQVAGDAVKKLASITKSMDYRLNMLVGFFLNIFFLWDIKQSIRIEKWKKKYSSDLEHWFDQLSIVDELQSFAGFAFINQDSVYPDFSENDFMIDAVNVKHPFISEKDSIGNPVNFSDWKQYHIITGANMAGKSTYLRTTGVNILLSMTGSVVLADKFQLTPVQLFTGIKTTDSLQDGESYFFAELKRLKEIIDRLESGEKIFIILDEVLRGTNSADKQKGSKALISQLLSMGASGMIATHDLELGKLKDEFPENVTNRRFEVEIVDNELDFDYKLKDGISQNLNATFLMKKMGITL